MTDPTIQTAAIVGLEFAVAKALALDPATATRLASMEGQVLHIACTKPEVTLYCLPGADGVQFKSIHDGATSSGISGTLSEFIELLQSKDKAAALINGNFQISGDSQALIQLQEALMGLDMDWEAPLSRVIGDVAAHQLGRIVRRGLHFGSTARKRAHDDIEAHLHAETGLLPRREELESFYQDVGQLSQRVERLQAKFRRWQKASQS